MEEWKNWPHSNLMTNISKANQNLIDFIVKHNKILTNGEIETINKLFISDILTNYIPNNPILWPTMEESDVIIQQVLSLIKKSVEDIELRKIKQNEKNR